MKYIFAVIATYAVIAEGQEWIKYQLYFFISFLVFFCRETDVKFVIKWAEIDSQKGWVFMGTKFNTQIANGSFVEGGTVSQTEWQNRNEQIMSYVKVS